MIDRHQDIGLIGDRLDFEMLRGFCDGRTDRRTDRRTDICDSRVAFATEKQLILNFTFSFLEEPSQNFDPQVIANFEENAKMMVCLVCGERFVSPNALIAHMLQVHGVEVRDSKYFTTIIGWFFLCFTKQASIY